MRSSLERVKLGTREGVDCVFLWLYTKQRKTYKKYSKQETAPAILIQLRHDGSFGTMGGKVDNGESLETALLREIKEESGIEFHNLKIEEIEKIATFRYISKQGKVFSIHSFALELDEETLLEARMVANDYIDKNNSLEVCGYNIVTLSEYDKSKVNNDMLCMETFFKNQFNSSAKAEIQILLENIIEENKKCY